MAKKTPIRVLVIEGHEMFREALAALLEGEAGMAMAGAAGALEEGAALVGKLEPDIVVLDQALPGAEGGAGITRIKQVSPGTKVLVLSPSITRTEFLEAADAGCDAYVTKERPFAELAQAIRGVLAGKDKVSPGLVVAPGPGELARAAKLSPRQMEVLGLMADGLPSTKIAERLSISPSTVRNHIQRILSRLDAHSRLEAVTVALREGLVRIR